MSSSVSRESNAHTHLQLMVFPSEETIGLACELLMIADYYKLDHFKVCVCVCVCVLKCGCKTPCLGEYQDLSD